MEIQPNPEAYADWYEGRLKLRMAEAETERYSSVLEEQSRRELYILLGGGAVEQYTQLEIEFPEKESPCPKTQLPGAYQARGR